LINKFKGDKDKAFKELDREIDANRDGGAPTYATPEASEVSFNEISEVQVFPLAN